MLDDVVPHVERMAVPFSLFLRRKFFAFGNGPVLGTEVDGFGPDQRGLVDGCGLAVRGHLVAEERVGGAALTAVGFFVLVRRSRCPWWMAESVVARVRAKP